MNVYDTLIIGCGYAAVGYAAANGNTVICEEHQLCDTGFYLPLRTFAYSPYSPKTAEGERLLEIFQELELFQNGQQNANGFEFALCKYITERPLNVLLKCRVVDTQKREDGIFDITIHTNEGLTHLFARKIFRAAARPSTQNMLTVLFTATDIDGAKKALLSAFDGGSVESAFYEGRYALHLPVQGLDENAVKLAIYQKWQSLQTDAKILYIAPVFYGKDETLPLCDMNFANPIEAFEQGYFYAAKEKNK